MENPTPQAPPSRAAQKIVFVLQVIVCILTFGMVFPNVGKD
jgi:hypothetical protein